MEDYNLFKMEGVGLNEGLGNEVKQEIENVGIEMPKLLEIAPGITSQLIEPEYFDEKALKAQPKKMFRLDFGDYRYYYSFDDAGKPIFYISVTTMIANALPTNQALLKYYGDRGYEDAVRYARMRADYGTFLHGEITRFCIDKTYNIGLVKERLMSYIEDHMLPASFIAEFDPLQRDLLAWAQFVYEYNVEVEALELVLSSDINLYAGAIDIKASLDYKGERIQAIIDNKSGRKGFFEAHEIQLHAYKEAWNENFPDCPVTKVFNWSPKDWRGAKPTFNFKDQTDSKSAKKLPYIIALAHIEDSKRENKVSCVGGIIEYGKSLEDNISMISIEEAVSKSSIETKPELTDAFSPEKPIEAENGNKNAYLDNYKAKEDKIDHKPSEALNKVSASDISQDKSLDDLLKMDDFNF
jgi:hypothetical protein